MYVHTYIGMSFYAIGRNSIEQEKANNIESKDLTQ